MTNFGNLPHEKLIAYQEARKLLAAVREACIGESHLRDQALRAATSVCLNISEGAGRASPADKARVFAIARGEASEAAAAVHVASLSGLCAVEYAERVRKIAARTVALLSGLIRR